MVSNVFAIHVFFSEVATLVLKNLAVHGEYLGKKAYFDLFLEFIYRVSINKDAFSSCMGMQVQKPEEFVLLVVVHNYFSDCIYGRVLLSRGVDIAPI